MGDEDGLIARPFLYLCHDLAQRCGSLGLIEIARVRSHLAEELILHFIAFRELGAFIALRCDTSDAGMGVPCLVAGLVFLGILRPCIEKAIGGHACLCTCFAPSRLIHQIGAVTVAQEISRPALTAVRRGHPAHAGLAITVQVDDGMAVVTFGNLIQHVGMIHVRRIARTGRIQPVGSGIVVARYRLGNRAACGEHALLGNGKGCLGFIGQCRTAQQHKCCQCGR